MRTGTSSTSHPYGAEILRHIEKTGVVDKDRHAGRSGAARGRSRGGAAVTLDLHGMTSEEARKKVLSALQSCRGRGFKRLIIIHGRGHHSDLDKGPVLKKMVREMLDNECKQLVRNYKPAPPAGGGPGATVVDIRILPGA